MRRKVMLIESTRKYFRSVGQDLTLDIYGVWRNDYGKPVALSPMLQLEILRQTQTIPTDVYVEIWLAGLVTLSGDASPRVTHVGDSEFTENPAEYITSADT
jgi:hypothetical protein